MVKKSLKWTILAYASEPDKNYKYEGDIVEYEGKRYFVSLAEERVEFLGLVKPSLSEEKMDNVSESKAFAELGKCVAAGIEAGIKNPMSYPEGVELEPEYIVNKDGSIKLTGFGLVRR